jgi:20S proteasome subunit beta 6
MLQVMLYYKRFFPYYTFNIIGGLDEEGKGAVYSFDPVGSYERESYRAGGSSGSLIQPFLDNQIGLKNQKNPDPSPLTRERAIKVIKDAFTSATERDIYTGDYLEIFLITKDGIVTERFDLKKD